MGRVSVIILNYNGLECIPRCLRQMDAQTFRDFQILVIDNASRDGSAEWIQAHRPDIRLIRNPENQWFCRGNNTGIRETDGEFVLMLNPDVFLSPGFLQTAVDAAMADTRIGGVQGKLWQITSADSPEPPPRLRIIDTTGCLVTRSRRNFDRYQEQPDDGRFDTPGPVFGPDGSAALYRRSMLEDIRLDSEYFDEDFLAYREIVDFNWRAQSRGWRFVYAPDATGFHMRGFSPRTRHRQSRVLRRLSYRNRYLTLIKNETVDSFLPHAGRILGFELLMMVYVLFREPHLMLAWSDLIRRIPGALKKRRRIQSGRRVPNRSITAAFQKSAPNLHQRK